MVIKKMSMLFLVLDVFKFTLQWYLNNFLHTCIAKFSLKSFDLGLFCRTRLINSLHQHVKRGKLVSAVIAHAA